MASIIKRCGCGDEDWDGCPHPWVVRYRTDGGRTSKQREQSFGGDLREAGNFLLKVEHDKKAHVFIDPDAGKAVFRAQAEAWLAQRIGADSSDATYRSVLRTHVYPAIGHRQIRTIRREEIKEIIAGMRRKGLSASRIAQAHLVINAVFNEAVRNKKLVLANPASDAQRDKATEFLAVAEQEIKALEAQVGDPDAIPDEHGDLPAARRGYNLDSHMRLFRHEALRAWSKGQRPRFRQLLAMPVPQPADMCPECQAPADWHTYGVSLRLFQPKPEPGSQAETIARLMPGWWERCPASTSIQIRQQWGQGLPDFDGAQWQAMLTPLLRAIFAPAPPRQREKPDQRAVLERRLRTAEAEARRIRRELGGLGPGTGEGRRQ